MTIYESRRQKRFQFNLFTDTSHLVKFMHFISNAMYIFAACNFDMMIFAQQLIRDKNIAISDVIIVATTSAKIPPIVFSSVTNLRFKYKLLFNTIWNFSSCLERSKYFSL